MGLEKDESNGQYRASLLALLETAAHGKEELRVTMESDAPFSFGAKVNLRHLNLAEYGLEVSVAAPTTASLILTSEDVGSGHTEIKLEVTHSKEDKLVTVNLYTPVSMPNHGLVPTLDFYELISLPDKLTVNYDSDGNRCSADVKLLLGTTKLVDLGISLEVNSTARSGSLDLTLDLPQHEQSWEAEMELALWDKVKFDFETISNAGNFPLTKLLVQCEVEKDGDKTITTYETDIELADGHFYKQKSITTDSPSSRKGHESIRQHLPRESYEQVSEYEITKNPSNGWPTAIEYKVTRDGAKMVEASASVTKKSDGFTASFELEIPPKRIDARGTMTLATDWKRRARLEATSNFPGFESVVLKVTGTKRADDAEDESSHGLEVLASLEVNGKQMAKVAAAGKSGPVVYKALLQVAVKKPAFKQKVEYVVRPRFGSGEVDIVSKTTLKGDLLDLSAQDNLEGRAGQKLHYMTTVVARGNFKCFLRNRPRERCREVRATFAAGIDAAKREAKVVWEDSETNSKLEFLGKATSYRLAKMDLEAKLEASRRGSRMSPLPEFAGVLQWDFEKAGAKDLKLLGKFGRESYSLIGVFDWTPEDSDITVAYRLVDRRGNTLKIDFSGKRSGYARELAYSLTADSGRPYDPVKAFDFKASNRLDGGWEDFEVDATLSSVFMNRRRRQQASPELSVVVSNKADAESFVNLEASAKFETDELILTSAVSRNELAADVNLEYWRGSQNEAGPVASASLVGEQRGDKNHLILTVIKQVRTRKKDN